MYFRGLSLGAILSCLTVTVASAQNWTSNYLAQQMSSMAMSANASVLLGAAGDSGAYASSDYGSNWINTPQTITRYGGLAASSADAKAFFLVSGSPFLACSTNYGQNWFFITTNGPLIHNFLVPSADGLALLAGSDNGLFSSTNGGVNWRTNSTGAWVCAASTADGHKWYAAPGNGGLLNSTDYGLTWKTNILSIGFSSVACSVDGNAVVGVTFAGVSPLVCVSTNGGLSWRTNAAPVPFNRPHVIGSADLRKLAYWLNPSLGKIYTSTNFGASWITNDPPQDTWTQVLVSADGNRMVAFKNGSMWVRNDASPPSLNLRRLGPSLVASWLVPSTPLQLQQASNSSAPFWFPATNAPTLNLSTLNNETLLSPDQDSAFFRLASPQ